MTMKNFIRYQVAEKGREFRPKYFFLQEPPASGATTIRVFGYQVTDATAPEFPLEPFRVEVEDLDMLEAR